MNATLFFEYLIENWNVLCGAVVWIYIVIQEGVYIRTHKTRDRKKDIAIERGHVVKAKREYMSYDDKYDVNSYYYATYYYQIDGCQYKYRYMGKNFPPLVATLYYVDNPRHTFSRIKPKRHWLDSPLYLILPTVAAVVIINLLGAI